MAFNLFLKEEAVADIDNAYSYYEEEKEGLGDRFLAELEFRFQAIVKTPHHYSHFHIASNFRSHSLDVFPYSIIYESSITT